jgi:AbrB family looped-hinge helix DNA binding protein
MYVVRTSGKSQIVIPKEVREKLGIIPGKKLAIRVIADHAEITPLPDNPIKAMRGIAKGKSSLTKALLEERAKDNETDEKHRF